MVKQTATNMEVAEMEYDYSVKTKGGPGNLP